MKKTLILTSLIKPTMRASFTNNIYTYSDIAVFIDMTKVKNERVKVLIANNDIRSYDNVYFRTWRKNENFAAPIGLYLSTFTIPFIDSEVALTRSSAKTQEYIACALNNYPIPRTIMAHTKKLLRMKGVIEDTFVYPYILKAAEGKRGKDNFLIKSFSHMCTILAKYPSNKLFIVQEFIPNTFDYRILVAGYKTSVVYQRIRNPKSSSHLNNVSKGGTRKLVKPESVKDLCILAENVSKLLNREICGVDIVLSSETGKPYILEANSAPQLNYPPALRAVKIYLEGLV